MDAVRIYKLGSLFDGSGGFPLAGAFCGIEPVWASEVEPYPIAVTRARFPNMKHLGDISKINGAEIEPVDVITFGSPCQDLSVAGKRAGLRHTDNGDEETTRSGLFMEAVRIIKEMRKATNGEYPRFALWENVPGAFSSNNGEDFRVVCEELIKIIEPQAFMPPVPKNGWSFADSYAGDGWSLAYRVFDAQYWGVPQRRRRIHLVADLRGGSAREVLFEREGLRGYFAEGGTAWQGTPANAPGSAGANDREGEGGNCITPWDVQSRRMYTPDGAWPSLYGGEGGGHGYVVTEPNGGDRGRHLDAVDPRYLFENHGQDSRYKGPLEICPMLSAQLGTGGNNQPLVMEPFCRSARGRFKGDAETWKAAKIANTLNTFDQGEARANELVVTNRPVYCLQGSMIGRAEKNGPQGAGINMDIAFTQNATDRPAVVYAAGFKAGQSPDGSIGWQDEVAPVLGANSSALEPTVVYSQQTRYIVRRLTPTECARLQGFADWWAYTEPKDDLADEEYRFWLEVRNTHAAINSRAVKEYTKSQMLTWYNKLHTDSAEYKMWGNGIALPPALYCMQGIAAALDADDTDDWML